MSDLFEEVVRTVNETTEEMLREQRRAQSESNARFDNDKVDHEFAIVQFVEWVQVYGNGRPLHELRDVYLGRRK